MSTQIQFRRGTTAQTAGFTGAVGEITVDTDKKTLVVHDGGTAGGFPVGGGTPVETQTVAATAVTTIGDTDLLSNVQTTGPALKKITWANVKATIWTALGGLIAGGTSKTVPTGTDLLPISDQAASSATKMLSIANLVAQFGPFIAAMTAKTVAVAGDGLLLVDSAAANANKLLTLTNLQAFIFAAFGPSIAAGTNKATPVVADKLLLSDSAATNASKYITLTNLFAALWTALGGLIAGGTSKAVPVGTDLIALSDQAASSATKFTSFANIFSQLGVFINAFTAKTTPVDADVIGVGDSAASFAAKAVTLANLATYIIAKVSVTVALLVGGQTLTGGFAVTSTAITWASFTLNPLTNNLQYGTNTGTITITAPTADGVVSFLMTNGAGAVIPTMSGFSVGTNVGDTVDTTSGHKFLLQVVRINGSSTYSWKALQ